MSTAEQNPSPSRLDWPHRGAAGFRTVLVLYADGKVMVPFRSYGGQNTGPEVPALVTDEFCAAADTLFGFTPGQKHARADPGWLRPSRVDSVLRFADRVAQEYAEAVRLIDADGSGAGGPAAQGLRLDGLAGPELAAGSVWTRSRRR